MMSKTIAGLIVGALLFSGCATRGGYEPTVDPYGDPRADRIGQDLYECRSLAYQSSGDTASNTARGTVIGGLIGAAAGAAIGAAAGDAGTGAAVGAAAGGFSGGAKEGFNTEEQFKRAYQNCMRGRGHNVID